MAKRHSNQVEKMPSLHKALHLYVIQKGLSVDYAFRQAGISDLQAFELRELAQNYVETVKYIMQEIKKRLVSQSKQTFKAEED